MKRLTLAVAVALVLLFPVPSGADSINMVVNGDFESGNVGFSSDYSFRDNGPNVLWQDGVYGIDKTATIDHSSWTTDGDHTTGTGNKMLVNGATVPGRTVWEQTISVVPAWVYDVSAWVENVCCNLGGLLEGPSLSLWANGIQLTACQTDGPGVWQQCAASLIATSRTIDLQLKDSVMVYSGNDFALDDIYFGKQITLDPVPEPASLVLLGSGGFGLVAYLRRRKSV